MHTSNRLTRLYQWWGGSRYHPNKKQQYQALEALKFSALKKFQTLGLARGMSEI